MYKSTSRTVPAAKGSAAAAPLAQGSSKKVDYSSVQRSDTKSVAEARAPLNYSKYENTMRNVSREALGADPAAGDGPHGATEELWSWGWGDGGRLGHGNLLDHKTPKYVSAFAKENITMVAGGLAHTVAVTEAGEGKNVSTKIYTWGFNLYGQLGHGHSRNLDSPTLISGLSSTVRIKQIACGESHTVILTTTGVVYQWGLGKTKAQAKPERLEPTLFQGQRLIRISCGSRHTLAVSGDGMLFTWGEGQKGQLGHPQLSKYLELPRLVDALRDIPVYGIAGGAQHSVVVTEDFNTVFTFGTSQYGELGHGEMNELSELPRPVEALQNRKIVGVDTRYHHSAAVADNGEVLTWGLGDSGQLGNGLMENCATPEVLSKFGRQYVRSVACGARHTIFLNAHGEIFTCGEARYGRLGHGDDEDISVPARVEGMGSRRVVAIATGHAHTMAISSIRADDATKVALEEVQQQMHQDDEPRGRRNLFVPDPEGYDRELRNFIARGRFTLDTMERWVDEVFPKTLTIDSVMDELLRNHLAHVKYMCNPPVLNEKLEEQKRAAILSSPSGSHRSVSTTSGFSRLGVDDEPRGAPSPQGSHRTVPSTRVSGGKDKKLMSASVPALFEGQQEWNSGRR